MMMHMHQRERKMKMEAKKKVKELEEVLRKLRVGELTVDDLNTVKKGSKEG